MTTSPSALELLGALRLEDGRLWGAVALPWQRADVAAVLDPDPSVPRRHYWLRGRGMSKSSDAAAIALALMLTAAPPRSRSYVYATDQDQAGLFADAVAGFVHRTGLAGAIELGARVVTCKATGATLSVESADGSSAYGTRPWLVVADELSVWPSTANHRRLWAAITSALPKVPGSRLIVTTTAGSPVGIGAIVWNTATADPAHWRTSLSRGPSPWWTEEDTAAAKASLTPSEWARLIECQWAEGDDTLATEEDILACTRPGSAVLPPVPGHSYIAALDIGTRRDWSSLAIGHAEQRQGGRVVVVDRVVNWKPERGVNGGIIDLSEVESSVLRLCKQYRVSKLKFDRMQAEQLSQNLRAAGIVTDEFIFSSAGVNKLAKTLFIALRDRAIELPDDPDVREQFLTTRMIETGNGTVKLANTAPGSHDDAVVTVAMLVAELSSAPVGRSSITNPADVPGVAELIRARGSITDQGRRFFGTDQPSSGQGSFHYFGSTGPKPGSLADPWGRRGGPRADRRGGGGRR